MTDLLRFLASTEIFAGLSAEALGKVHGAMQSVRLEAGEVVFAEGDGGDAAYIVVSGRLRLESDGVHLLSRGPGECVGEFALIDDGPRSASAVAQTATHLLRWERAQFHELLLESPEVARGVFRILTAKLREDISIQVGHALEKERWRQDLQRAREIQMGMLPAGDLRTPEVAASGFCQPAVEVGGDYYDFLSLQRGKLGIIVADVTGHGFYSGLFVAMVKACLHTLSDVGYAPHQVMHAMRRTLSLSIRRRLLMSCCFVLLDPRAGKLAYANAGHPFPYLYRSSGGRLERLGALDPILGALELDQLEFRSAEIGWSPGDVLVMYSDGLTEQRDLAGRLFGHERLEEAIVRAAGGSTNRIKAAILETLHEHGRGASQSDDVTLVVAKAIEAGEGAEVAYRPAAV